MSQQRILIADCAGGFAQQFHQPLLTDGYDVRLSDDLTTVHLAVNVWKPEVMLLGQPTPSTDIADLCRQVHENSAGQSAVVVIAPHVTGRTRASYFDAGADECIATLITPEEMCARVRSLLRRLQRRRTQIENLIKTGDLLMNCDLRRLLVRGREVRLTPKEYDLMLYFMRHPDQLLSRHDLLQAISSRTGSMTLNQLYVLVARIRGKLEPGEKNYRYIIRGSGGYMLRPAESSAEI